METAAEEVGANIAGLRGQLDREFRERGGEPRRVDRERMLAAVAEICGAGIRIVGDEQVVGNRPAVIAAESLGRDAVTGRAGGAVRFAAPREELHHPLGIRLQHRAVVCFGVGGLREPKDRLDRRGDAATPDGDPLARRNFTRVVPVKILR